MAHYGDRVMIAEVNGKPNVVTTYSTAAAKIVHDFHKNTKNDPNDDKLRLIETAAKLTKYDIKIMRPPDNVYISNKSKYDFSKRSN